MARRLVNREANKAQNGSYQDNFYYHSDAPLVAEVDSTHVSCLFSV